MDTLIACAAVFLGYFGPMHGREHPPVFVDHREVSESECQAALSSERAWFESQFGPNVECRAVTTRKGIGVITIVIPENAKERTRRIEALRVIFWLRDGQQPPSREVYALADRWRGCSPP